MTQATPTQIPTIAIETVTPDEAKTLLASMVDNQRAIKVSQVQRLKNDLLNGRWEVTTDAVGINTDGRLYNGQHRMAALVEAAKTNPNITADFLIARNMDDLKAMAVTDTGVRRGLKDNLFMKYAKTFTGRSPSWFATLSPIVSRAHALDNGLLGGGNPVSIPMILEWFENNQDASKSVPIADQVYGAIGITRPVAGACHYLFSRDCDPELATEFFELVKKGDVTNPNSAPNALRRRMTHLSRQASWSPGATTNLQLGLVIKAWNAWLSGTEVKVLRFNPTESVPSWTKTYQALND